MTIRCFIAVELDLDVHKALARLQKQLQARPELNDRSINWVRTENIHLTLKFLGDVNDPDIIAVCDAATCTAAGCDPFDFDIGTVGSFPPAAAARVLWTGITSSLDRLEFLAKTLDNNLHLLGYPLEARRFSPHLTLARIKNTQIGHLARQTIQSLDIPTLANQSVTCLTVFQSTLSRSGPTYTPLHHAPLARK